jgi:hypothetical protein
MDAVVALIVCGAVAFCCYRFRDQLGAWYTIQQARSDAHRSRQSKQVTKYRKRTSFGGHLLMSILTLGLWVPVWAFMAVWHAVGPRRKIVTTYEEPKE